MDYKHLKFLYCAEEKMCLILIIPLSDLRTTYNREEGPRM